MSKLDKTALKAIFKEGAVPTEAQFASLIDSQVNLEETGNPTESVAIDFKAGFAVITHPLYQNALEAPSDQYSLNTLQFQGTHLIYEHEYQCTLDEHEFTDTLNPSARKIRSHQSADLADFATGSLFRPYITTIGLYNENNELLVVGKLGQPIRTSNETDTTIILRWDTYYV